MREKLKRTETERVRKNNDTDRETGEGDRETQREK